jgi:hypothetical protein
MKEARSPRRALPPELADVAAQSKRHEKPEPGHIFIKETGISKED